MRAIFFGSPEFAVPCLDALTEVADVALVVSQPDRPAGRGLALRPPPVKVRAEALGLPVIQPSKVRTVAFAETLARCEADVGVVVAYGRILPRRVLDAPRRGCVNVHASLLPRWRGAAPIHYAVWHGDAETGVTLMEVDDGMDEGAIIATERTAIGPNETTGELSERLAVLGAELLRAELPAYVAGERVATPQDDARATYAALLDKSAGEVDWARDAHAIHDQVRGLHPWPGAFTTLDGATIKLHETRVAGTPAVTARAVSPGTIVEDRKSVV